MLKLYDMNCFRKLGSFAIRGRMKRGDVYDARLEPVEGLEQGGTRPVIYC